jgi:hypothetical protein
MRTILCGLAILTACLTGCSAAQPLLRPEMGMMSLSLLEDANEARRLEKALTDPQIADLLDADIKAKLPTPLAVAKVSSRYCGDRPHLDLISAQELQGWSQVAEGLPQIRGVRVIPNLDQDSSVSLWALRHSAAKMGCELLLVYLQGDSSVDNYNDAAVLYWTFIGLWLAPGNTYERLTVTQAVLVDCRTGAVLGTAAGEGRLSRSHAAAFTEITRDQLDQEAPRKAMESLQKAFSQTLREVVQAADSPSRALRTAPPPRGHRS